MFDGIVKRDQEYAQYAYDNGFKMGPENHQGPEGVWPNMQKLFKAMNKHPGVLRALRSHVTMAGHAGREGPGRQGVGPLGRVRPFRLPTRETRLVEKMNLLRDAGYKGYWIVEHHGGTNEYAEVGVQVAHVRAVLESWRTGGSGEPARAWEGRPPESHAMNDSGRADPSAAERNLSPARCFRGRPPRPGHAVDDGRGAATPPGRPAIAR